MNLFSYLIRNSQISSFVKEFEFKEKHEYPSEQGKKEILKLKEKIEITYQENAVLEEKLIAYDRLKSC